VIPLIAALIFAIAVSPLWSHRSSEILELSVVMVMFSFGVFTHVTYLVAPLVSKHAMKSRLFGYKGMAAILVIAIALGATTHIFWGVLLSCAFGVNIALCAIFEDPISRWFRANLRHAHKLGFRHRA